MNTFNEWIQQFIISKGRASFASKKLRNIDDKRYITVSCMDKPLHLGTPEFDKWLSEKQKAFEGIQLLKKGLDFKLAFTGLCNEKIKEKIKNPKTFIGDCDAFLKNRGVNLSDSEDGHPVSSIRITPSIIAYGFKNLQDCESMANVLIKHGIDFSFDTKSKGARYEYHFIVNRTDKEHPAELA